MSLPRVVRGHDGPIEIDETRQTVTKTYLYLNRETAVEAAKREVTCALRLYEALSRIDGLSCPRILASDFSPPPRVTMGLCPGEPLSQFLRRIGKRDARRMEIAGKIHDGLLIYTRLFDEPYYDFCFQNILYDEATAVLTLLDFGIPFGVDIDRDRSPLEASLGTLIGCAWYDVARPVNLLAPNPNYLEVIRAILAAFEGGVSKPQVFALARAAFLRLTTAGSILRRSYYKTAGAVVSRRYVNRLQASPASPDFASAPHDSGENTAIGT